jgi:hypothetical protein
MLSSLDATELLDAAMIFFNSSGLLGLFGQLPDGHRQVIGSPVLNAAVWGSNLEHLDETIPLEMHYRTRPGDQLLANRMVPSPIRIHQAIALQLGQPMPVQSPHILQVFQTRVPAIKSYQLRFKAAFRSCLQHGSKMIVLRQLILFLGVYPKITWPMSFAFRPQQANQIDAHHDPVMLARPMTSDQFHCSGVWLVQRAVIDDQNTPVKDHTRLDFFPQRLAIRSYAVQQTGVSVMRWTFLLGLRVRAGGFGVAKHFLRRYQKVNVIQFITFWLVHAPKFTLCASTA